MNRKSILITAVLVLALVTLSCNTVTNFRVQEFRAGPTQTEDINLPKPQSDSADVELDFSAGVLNLNPGATGALIEGTATYNVQELKPESSTSGNNVVLKTGNFRISGIPAFRGNYENTWDLKLADMPMNLTIKAGAYQGRYELGGLALKSLDVTDGASEVTLDFTEPNKTEMDTLRYETGASSIVLNGLANANFRSMVFKSGAGSYTLDFSGDLKRDADIQVQSGISQVVIVVPQGANARVSFTGGVSNVDRQGSWEQNGNTYTLTGSGPTLNFDVNMGAGNLELRTR